MPTTRQPRMRKALGGEVADGAQTEDGDPGIAVDLGDD